MNKPFISFLITCKNEGIQLKQLLEKINNYIDGNECIILDDYSDDVLTLEILNNYNNIDNFHIYKHNLEKNYSSHKNFGKDLCHGNYILQLDSDELPTDELLLNLKSIADANPMVEMFWIPRVNIFKGITEKHALQWNWKLTDSPYGKLVNFPDLQSRFFKNLSYIRWERPLHEKIEGAKITSKFPNEFELSIQHYKTIEKQVETNLRYNREFSNELNKGFNV